MRTSPKQLLVKKAVSWTFAFKTRQCEACCYQVWFEAMFMVKSTGEYFCKNCHSSKEQVYDHVFSEVMTPAKIIERNARKKANAVLLQLTNEINSLPDGEVSPSVHSIVVKCLIEGGVEYG